MEIKTHYTAIGFFVVVLFALFVGVMLWLSSGTSRAHYDFYIAEMHESVTGLSLNSPVKYNGVNVGFVKKILLDASNPEIVRVILAIEKNVSVREDTLAILETQGITGITYVGLRGGSQQSPILHPKKHEEYPKLQTGQSMMSRLDSTVKNLSNDIESVSTAVRGILSEENQQSFKSILQNFDHMSATLASNSDGVTKFLNNMNSLLQGFNGSVNGMPHVAESMQGCLNSFQKMACELTHSAKDISATLQASRQTVQAIAGQVLPQTYVNLQKLSKALDHVNEVAQEAQQNPAVLTRGKSSTLISAQEK